MDKDALTRKVAHIIDGFLRVQDPLEPEVFKPQFDHRPMGGSSMRGSTVRRLKMQQAVGLSPFRKEVVLADGRIIHPTKGHVYGHRSPPALPRRPYEDADTLDLRLKLAGLTNWQRTGYCRELRQRHVDEQSLAVRLRVANKWSRQKRRKKAFAPHENVTA